MRIMAIDLGDTRTGLAVSDPTGTLAGEAWTITERNFERTALLVAEAAKSRSVSRLVLGYPKNMDNSLGPRAEKSIEFKHLLEEMTGLDVVLWDERRTTVQAESILIGQGRRGKKKKQVLDAVAASLILEGYLSSL